VPRVLLTWILLVTCVVVLMAWAANQFMSGKGNVSDVIMSVLILVLFSSAVLNARASGIQAERRHFEAESFSRIMRALSRSVSPDAVVEAIVHELGTATQADHVAVVRVRPGSSVLDVTFVSMLPGALTSNTVMPMRQLEPFDTKRLRELPRPRPNSNAVRLGDGEVSPVWREGGHPDPVGAANAATAALRQTVRTHAFSRGPDGETLAREVADRIAYRLRDAYGLRNTLAAPLQSDQAIAGAIVLSRRTGEVWPDSAIRLLNAAAFETSAALARVYSHQAAESEARTDQLTQLPNRRYFDEYCKLLTSRRRVSDGLAILSIDVDHFKKLNDAYGHHVGDLVLRSIANAIQLSVRDEDVPVRFGGEEFVVLLRNPSQSIGLEIGERIRKSVRDLDLSEAGVEERVTVSVGVATGHHAGETIEDIVERADKALYAAKRTGRDRVVEAWSSDIAQ
jgi:diguanylate cyclase (GGDEF)-like protein